MQTTLFENLPVQFNDSLTTGDLPLFQLAECKAMAKPNQDASEEACREGKTETEKN